MHPLYSLLLYGMLCCLDERYLEAGEFFELATTTDPNNVIAWTIRGKNARIIQCYYTRLNDISVLAQFRISVFAYCSYH